MLLFILLTCKDFIPAELQFTWVYFKHAKKETKTCQKPLTNTIFPSLHFKFLFENRNAVLLSDKDVLHKQQDAAFSYCRVLYQEVECQPAYHHRKYGNHFFWGKNINPYSVHEPSFTLCKTQLLTEQWSSLG